MTNNYRDKIYEKYSTVFQGKDAALTFDTASADAQAEVLEKRFAAHLPTDKNAAIAELACGGGNFLYFLKSRGYTNLTGIDISPQQVALARQVIPQVEEGNLIAFLEKNPERFDLITAFDLIEHLTKDEVLSFIEKAYTALKPEGKLLLQTPNGDSPFVGTVLYGDFTHEICLNPASISKLLKLCGFADIACHEMGPVVHGFVSWIRRLLWWKVRLMLKFIHLIETGSAGSGIFTRVFYVVALKRENS